MTGLVSQVDFSWKVAMTLFLLQMFTLGLSNTLSRSFIQFPFPGIKKIMKSFGFLMLYLNKYGYTQQKNVKWFKLV